MSFDQMQAESALANFFNNFGLGPDWAQNTARASVYGGVDPNAVTKQFLPASESDNLGFLAHMAGPNAQEYASDNSLLGSLAHTQAGERTANMQTTAQGQQALALQKLKNQGMMQMTGQNKGLDFISNLIRSQASIQAAQARQGPLGQGIPDVVKMQLAQKIAKNIADPVEQAKKLREVFGTQAPGASINSPMPTDLLMLMGMHGAGNQYPAMSQVGQMMGGY